MAKQAASVECIPVLQVGPPFPAERFANGKRKLYIPLRPTPKMGAGFKVPLPLWATVYTYLGPLPLGPPLPKMGEGEARQDFPAPLLPFWEKGLGDEGKVLQPRLSGLMCTQ